MNQVFNPYLPLYEYVPDGEPHVFGERVYIFGSHDRFDGGQFCLNDYVSYSADIHDLKNWRFEGVIYRAAQDPVNQLPEEERIPLPDYYGFDANLNPPGIHQLWAPDVVQGADGRYYMYYCMDFLPEIAVAVCDTPAGKYEYLGRVRHADGTLLGRGAEDYEQFDPGIFRDDDGTFYLYSGNCSPNVNTRWPGRKASQVMKLENDMLTVKGDVRLLLPDCFDAVGTPWQDHPFFEASSIRKINGRYYLVYSSGNSHELCYAVSDRPDEGYVYGGTLVDIGDCYLNGRRPEEALNPLGNTHGGLENVGGKWYVFYHRQTNRTNYSRQGCAEPVEILEDGSILQAEVTSCGLNGGPLKTPGRYPASICCRLTAKEGAPFSSQEESDERFPYIRQIFPDVNSNQEHRELINPAQCIMNLKNGSTVGYKYFAGPFSGRISLSLRGYGRGEVKVAAVDRRTGESLLCGTVDVTGRIEAAESRVLYDGRMFGGAPGEPFHHFRGDISIPFSEFALYLRFSGDAVMDLHTVTFE